MRTCSPIMRERDSCDEGKLVNDKPYSHGRTDCCIVGCDNECVHGVCDYHRRFFKLHGHQATPADRLAFLRARCNMVGFPDPCWEPDAKSINEKGYVWVMFYGTRKMRGHRLAYRLQRIIDGGKWSDLKPRDYVLHSPLCEERFIKGLIKNRCWNPAHLRIGTMQENAIERVENRLKHDPFVRRECMAEDCKRRAISKGYCGKCYKQWKRAEQADAV